MSPTARRATFALSASDPYMAALVSGRSVRAVTAMIARYATTSSRCPLTRSSPTAITRAKATLTMRLKYCPGLPLTRRPSRVEAESASRAACTGAQPVLVAPVARSTGWSRANSTRRPAAALEVRSSISLARVVAAPMSRHVRTSGTMAAAMMSARGHSTTAVAPSMTSGTMKALHRLGITMEARWERVLTSLEVALTTAASRSALNQPSGRVRT